MRGDRVEVLIDTGHEVRGFDVVASRDGRRVEVNTRRNLIEVVEVTRTGQPVRTARFLASRVVAIVEHPAADNSRPKRPEPTTLPEPRDATAG
jgi:nucleoside-diphosphate-sugar epimerase